MTNPTQETLILQRLDALENRVEDLAIAFAKLRPELDATTESARELLMWVVHRPLERPPELKSPPPFEE